MRNRSRQWGVVSVGCSNAICELESLILLLESLEMPGDSLSPLPI